MTDSSLFKLKRLLGQTMFVHRFRFKRRIENLEKKFAEIAAEKIKSPVFLETRVDLQERFDKDLASLAADMTASAEQVRKRRQSIGTISYPPELPVCEKRDEIAKLIRDHQVIVLCGETGSGKSTQLPKICLELGRGLFGTIGHTQPRRIAARSVAERIAHELGTNLGQTVGYKIRFADETGPNTLVKIMTDGILLAESQTDPFFDQYDTIIIDEAHERSLNIDFLLGMLKRILPRRPKLKLIITSATIDAERFARHFSSARGPAPVIEVSGRNYPIDIVYRPVDELPIDEENDIRDDEDLHQRALLEAIDELARMERGDILIFMPTERDIFETAKLLKHHAIPRDDAARKTEILPLYARLPSSEQQKIFQPASWRKIVIATNVAESSLTVPGIRYVIDTGTARISRYSARSRTQRLPIEPISQASADQRAGRCGRTGPGVCIRLYSREDYDARDRYTTPEIRRTNLASVILQTKAFRLGAVERFPFIDPPSMAAINEGYKTLFELGALDENNNLTELGTKLGHLPVDPRIARMILAADAENCLREMLIIASVLAIQDPRERPLEAQKKADEAHTAFIDEQSDFLSFLKIWDFWGSLKNTLSRNRLSKACRQNFLSYNRMREWSDIHLQLLQLAHQAKLPVRPRRQENQERYDAIHRAILTGLLYGVAKKTDALEYQTTGNAKFFLWPGSGLFKKKYSWILAAERVETSKKYLRCIAKIDPEWIEPLAKHILVSTYFEPFWNRETGYVHAMEKVTLYGLTIVPRRRINYGPIHPEQARELFIENALVQRDYDCRLDFFQKNSETMDQVEKLQAKLRRYGLLAGRDVLYRFYNERIPDNVYDHVTLTKWYKALSPDEKRTLILLPSELCTEEISAETLDNFPDSFASVHGNQFPLDYQFHPGMDDDGISVVVPADHLGQLDTRQAGWLVPGLFEQKIIALLKALPKELRRELVPIPDTAREMIKLIPFGQGDLITHVAQQASRLAGKLVTREHFDLERVPHELMLNIRVVDHDGKTVVEGRDLCTIQNELGVQARQTVAAAIDPKWNRDNISSWDFGALPESIDLNCGGMTVKAFPALVDPRLLTEESELANHDFKSDSTQDAALRLFDSPAKAQALGRSGPRLLFCRIARNDLKTQAKWIPDIQKHNVFLQTLPGPDAVGLCAELIGMLALEADGCKIPQCEGDFNHLVQQGKSRIARAAQEITWWIGRLAQSVQAARVALERNAKGPFQNAANDAKKQYDRLFTPFYYLKTPWAWLKEYPRYLDAITARFEKIKSGGAQNDSAMTEEIDRYWRRYTDAKNVHLAAGIVDLELEVFRWMIEEYRVSLFAQKLGTSVKVSPVRLDKQFEKITK